jgi:outer membrane protein assembly factor BamB
VAGEPLPPAVEVETVAGWILPLTPTTGPGDFSCHHLTVPGATRQHQFTLRNEAVHAFTDTQQTTIITHRVGGVEAGPAQDHRHQPGTPILPFGWRGDGSGRYPDAVTPAACRVVWKLPLNHWVLSSPIIAGDAILTLDHPHTLVCADRATGAVRWTRTHPIDICGNGRVEMGYPRNDFVANTYLYTTPTPISDGERIHVVFGHGVVACWTLAGDLVWTNHFRTEVIMRSGVSISPCLVGEVLVIGGAAREGIAGYDRRTGRVRWRVERKGAGRGQGNHIAARLGGRELALASCGVLVDPADGRIVAQKLVKGNYGPSPVAVDGIAYLADSSNHHTTAWRIGADDSAEQLWTGGPADSRSPLVHDGIAYLPGDQQLVVLDARTGNQLGTVPLIGKWSSPVLFGDAILQVGRDQIQVISRGPEPRELSRFKHPFGSQRAGQGAPWDWSATPVADGNRWYHRGPDALWCLAADATPPGP